MTLHVGGAGGQIVSFATRAVQSLCMIGAGLPTEATYQFNSWRVGYRFAFVVVPRT